MIRRSFNGAGLHGPALLLFAVGWLLAGCAHRPVTPPAPGELAAALSALDASVDAHDAAILATVAVQTSSDLAAAYRARPPAWLHNIFVNAGWRPRGLCYHWADDLEARLRGEHLATLEIHRIVARLGTSREHSALAVTARGRPFATGLVLDAWRGSGRLFWGPVPQDKYRWGPRFPVAPPGPAPVRRLDARE